MNIQTNQKSKEDNRIARIVLLAESDEDYELLEDMLHYLKYREAEIKDEEQYANL